LDYFEKTHSYTLYDGEDCPVRTIKGREARILSRLLTPAKMVIKDDLCRAFAPLLAVAFPREFDLSDEGEAYRLELVAKQPRIYPRESEEEVYRRYWTGHLMPGRISAEQIAERIVKSESRVRVAAAWGQMGSNEIDQTVADLAAVIRQYHPQGEKGK
jgi:hypothetical protein